MGGPSLWDEGIGTRYQGQIDLLRVDPGAQRGEETRSLGGRASTLGHPGEGRLLAAVALRMRPVRRLVVTFPRYNTSLAAGHRGVCSCSPHAGDSVRELEAPSLHLVHSAVPLVSV